MPLRRHSGERPSFRQPFRTVRSRLTLIYGGLFIALGGGLLAITGLLWQQTTRDSVSVPLTIQGAVLHIPGLFPKEVAAGPNFVHARETRVPPPGSVSQPPSFGQALSKLPPGSRVRHQIALLSHQLVDVASTQRGSDLHRLLFWAGLALAGMAVIALLLGWLTAGRVLRPLRTITSTARDISATNLHARLDLNGPDDELKRLGDTIDELLERLEGSFQAQKQFVANASHELRTPLTTMRAYVDVALAKPGGVHEETRVLGERLHVELDHLDALLDGLLTLARAERLPESEDAVMDLAAIASAALEARASEIAESGITVHAELSHDAKVVGSPTLLRRMVANVVANAVRHNERGGFVEVSVGAEGDEAHVVISNGGDVIGEESMRQLGQPFRRLVSDRTGSESGTGLGLSIVSAIAGSHGGRLELAPRPEGGVVVRIVLPLESRVPAGAGAPA